MKLHLRAAALAAAVALFAGSASAEEGTLKVGLLSITTGPFVALGAEGEHGLNLLLEENDNVLGGTRIELVVADTSATPATALARAQELVTRHGVDVVIGPVSSAEALAIHDYMDKAGVPLISHSALADDLTQRLTSPWFVRATGTAGQMSHVAGDHAAKELGHKRIATIATDFAFGHEIVGGFQRVFEEDGGMIVNKVWVPVNAIDFGSYIAQIGDVDAVYASFSGPAAVNFLRQYREFGYADRIPLLGSHALVDENVLKQTGADADGVISAAVYTPGFDDPTNRAYVEKYVAKYGSEPGFYSTGGYMAGLILKTALENLQAAGDSEADKEKLMAALRSVEIAESPRGPFEVDDFGNPVAPVHIRKTETVDGKTRNEIVKVVPQVSQFWNYAAEEFLKDPVYSRDFPPANNLGK